MTVRQRRAVALGKYALAVAAGLWLGVMIGAQHRTEEIAQLYAQVNDLQDQLLLFYGEDP